MYSTDNQYFLRVCVEHVYESLDQELKDDLVEALAWARTTLAEHEGSGHSFHLSVDNERRFICSFAKAEWSGDHSGPAMWEAPAAITMAVLTYLGGL